MGSLVIVLLQFFPDSDSEKKFKNWSIFDEGIRRTKSVQFLGGPPVGFKKLIYVWVAQK